MIAQKKQEVTITSEDLYELFNEVTMKSTDGSDVNVLQSLGYFSLSDLIRQKEYHNSQIVMLQEKISLIESINTENNG